MVTLVFPDMDEGVAVADISTPASNKVDLIFLDGSHTGVPVAYELDVLVYLVRLDRVEYNRVDVLATGENGREGSFELGIQLSSFLCPVDEVR